MRFDRQQDIKIAARAALDTGFTFAGQADAPAGINAGRDFDFERFVFFDAALTVALFARVGDDLSSAVAGRAGAFDGEESLLLANAALAIAGRAITSSPGRSSAKPRISNPHPRLDTDAGANTLIPGVDMMIAFGQVMK